MIAVMGQELLIKLDIGSAHSVVSERVWKSLGSPTLTTAPKLSAYGGFPLSVLGRAIVTVGFQGKTKELELIVVKSASTSLLGRKWINSFQRLHSWFDNAPNNNVIAGGTYITELCNEFSKLFEPGLGKMLNYKAHIYIKPDARFRFFKPRPVAFAIRSKIETELDRLLKFKVIEPVQTAECGARPVVPVAKPNGAVRICGDFKVTVNT